MMPAQGQMAFDFIRDRRAAAFRKAWNTNNVYLALKPSMPDAISIDEQAERVCWQILGDTGRVKPTRFHVSLCSIGTFQSLPARFEEEVDCRMSGICGAPISLRFDRISDFGGGSIVLRGGPAGPVNILRHLIMTRLASFRHFVGQPKHIEPHVTVWYSELGFPERRIQAIFWTAAEVVLVHSFHGHRILGRWPLIGPADIYDRIVATAKTPDLFNEHHSGTTSERR